MTEAGARLRLEADSGNSRKRFGQVYSLLEHYKTYVQCSCRYVLASPKLSRDLLGEHSFLPLGIAFAPWPRAVARLLWEVPLPVDVGIARLPNCRSVAQKSVEYRGRMNLAYGEALCDTLGESDRLRYRLAR